MKVGAWKLPVRGPGAVQALRMTAASLAAFGLATALALPQGFWAVITALIVTQSNVGGSLKAAFDRFAGSVCGAVYGGAVAFLIPHATPLLRAAALVVAVGPLSLLAAASAGFRVAPITAIIVLLGTSGATLGPFGFALDRILEVGLGCVVGLLASVLVVPARASLTVLAHARRIARLLAEQMETLAEPGSVGATGGGALATSIRKGLTGLETLIGEAAHVVPPSYAKLLVTFRWLLPMSYLVCSAMIPFLSTLMNRMNIDASMHPILSATWLLFRTLGFVFMERSKAWHGRWWHPALAMVFMLI